MLQALQNVDCDLLHQQKQILVSMRASVPEQSPEFEALSGIIHLLDAIQDEAVDQGRWTFPDSHPFDGCTQ